jgi:inner membrane protein involved in colicin E2 resistance
MSDKLNVSMWGVIISAEGWLAIGATVVIVAIIAAVLVSKRA